MEIAITVSWISYIINNTSKFCEANHLYVIQIDTSHRLKLIHTRADYRSDVLFHSFSFALHDEEFMMFA